MPALLMINFILSPAITHFCARSPVHGKLLNSCQCRIRTCNSADVQRYSRVLTDLTNWLTESVKMSQDSESDSEPYHL